MVKYSSGFKEEVAKAYLQGKAARPVAARYGVAYKRVQRWAALYQRHGKAGLDGLHQHYSVEFRLQVLQHMEREGLSLGQATVLYGIGGNSTVSRWVRLYHANGIEALSLRPRGRPPAMTTKPLPPPSPPETESTATHKELLKENEHLRAEVAYLKKVRALVRAKESTRRKKPGSCSN